MLDSSAVRFNKIAFCPKRPVLLKPLFLFSAVWLGVSFLYSLHLSDLLLYSPEQELAAVFFIWLPFAAVAVVFAIARRLLSVFRRPITESRTVDLTLLESRLNAWFKIWVAISLAEIAASRGLPLLWTLEHSSKTYFDFGIPSVHGLVNSLLLSISLCRVSLFLITRQRKHLLIPGFVLLWSVVVITRSMILLSLLQWIVVWLRVNSVRMKTILVIVLIFTIFILGFGVIGDMRSGSEAFRALAQPTREYPDWLPSGVLWAYIYITTPINNLLYTMESTKPANDPLFSNTAALLFPTVLRKAIYGGAVREAESGELVTQAFNVSTAYIGPYEDFGIYGIVFFSVCIALLSHVLWVRSGLRNILMFAVVVQCLILTLFFNQFCHLPNITELVWLGVFFANRRLSLFKKKPYRAGQVMASNEGQHAH
jgi:oligosaccharide repeat unit polymerase